jgi:hypothetical protein
MPAHEIPATKTFADVFGIGLRLDPIERAGQLGRLTGLACAQLSSSHPCVLLLRQAELGDNEALAQAPDLVSALPPLQRRRIVASNAALQWLRRVAKPRREPLERRWQ